MITVLAALSLVAFAEIFAVLSAPSEPSAIEKLNEAPGSDVFVFGNSMFQTGVDFSTLSDVTDREIIFDYHNGHYTNLWYLIADQALPEADPAPSLVVWGFRPAYAAEPAFRGTAPNDNDLFEPGDNTYKSLTIGASPPIQWWDAAGHLRDGAETSRGLWSRRDGAQASLSDQTTKAGINVVGVLRPEDTQGFRERFASGDVTVTDEILRIATGGEFELAEEQVVDGEGDFVRGPIVPFTDSFIPRIVDKIDDAGIDQLVVIWKPVAAVNGTDVARDDAFVTDTRAYLDAEGIAYVDMYHDEDIPLEMFASGDHYNAEGRDYITTVLAEVLAE